MKRKAKILFIQKDFNKEFFILLGRRRSSNEEFWWIPGGSVEAGESDFEGALRELDEELFLTDVYKQRLHTFVQAFVLPAHIEYQSNQANNIIFFVMLPGLDKQTVPAIRDEFEEMKWFRLEALPVNMSREFAFIEKDFVQQIKAL